VTVSEWNAKINPLNRGLVRFIPTAGRSQGYEPVRLQQSRYETPDNPD